MMTDCWSPTPGVRPSFEKLVMQLGSLLEDSTKRVISSYHLQLLYEGYEYKIILNIAPYPVLVF